MDSDRGAPPPLPPPRHSSSGNTAYRRSPKGQDNRDESCASWSSNERTLDSLPTHFGLQHSSFQFQSPADLNGASMQQIFNPLRTSDASSPLNSSSDVPFSRRPAVEHRLPLELSMPVKLPCRPHMVNSPAAFSDTPEADVDQSPKGHSEWNNSDNASRQRSYDHITHDIRIDDSEPLNGIHEHSIHASGRAKRRAASPPLVDGSILAQDDLRRREPSTRDSRAPRLATQGPMPILSRSNSYVSTASAGQSIAMNTTPYEHRSPDATCSGGISSASGHSTSTTSVSLNPGLRDSSSALASLHSAPRRLPEVQKQAGSKLHPALMCECCPKDPRKCDTEENLKAHAAEKQHSCAHCGDRFKNKNDAKRHQNTIHVRRHSWSCSALFSFHCAFHESKIDPGEADICGYCGISLPRPEGATIGRVADEEHWAKHIRHIEDTHKFGGCNSSKKFFRADHFRQHLTHRHAATSGTWTRVLEAACMIEEEPTAPPAPG